jgi:hypothetical protein
LACVCDEEAALMHVSTDYCHGISSASQYELHTGFKRREYRSLHGSAIEVSMMNFLLRFLRSRMGNGMDAVVHDVEKRLKGRVPDIVMAQATARAKRRLAQGCSPASATHLAVIWAINVDHPEVAS